MTDDNDVYTPAQFREHQERHSHRDPDSHPHGGIVRDPRVSRFLSIVEENYDARRAEQPGEMPGQARDLDEIQEIRAISATETGRKGLENGDMPSLKHLTGDQNQQADISGIRAIQKIDKIIESPAPVIVVLGEMGSGKTDFANLLGQRATHLLGVKQIASNVPTLRETTEWEDRGGNTRDGFVPDYPTLQEWVKQDGEPMGDDEQRSKLFIGDEFSSVGSGVGKSGYQVRTKMGPLVFKIRKFGGMLIYIAHDASSIHPLLWRVGKIIKKESKKEAVIADRISNGEIKDVEGRIEGIPQTDWRYDTQDPAVWSWNGETSESETPEPGSVAENVAIWTVIHNQKRGLSYRDTAENVPYSHEWVRSRWNEYKDDGMHRNAVDRVEEYIA